MFSRSQVKVNSKATVCRSDQHVLVLVRYHAVTFAFLDKLNCRLFQNTLEFLKGRGWLTLVCDEKIHFLLFLNEE